MCISLMPILKGSLDLLLHAQLMAARALQRSGTEGAVLPRGGAESIAGS